MVEEKHASNFTSSSVVTNNIKLDFGIGNFKTGVSHYLCLHLQVDIFSVQYN